MFCSKIWLTSTAHDQHYYGGCATPLRWLCNTKAFCLRTWFAYCQGKSGSVFELLGSETLSQTACPANVFENISVAGIRQGSTHVMRRSALSCAACPAIEQMCSPLLVRDWPDVLCYCNWPDVLRYNWPDVLRYLCAIDQICSPLLVHDWPDVFRYCNWPDVLRYAIDQMYSVSAIEQMYSVTAIDQVCFITCAVEHS